MISISRIVASIIPYVYAMYLPVQSIFLPGFNTRYLEMIALVIYFYAATATLLLFRGLLLPRWQAFFNLGAALAMPSLVLAQREIVDDHAIGSWVVMGTAVVLTATAVRQRAKFALIGLATLLTILIFEYGQGAITTVGLAGALVFVMAGLAVSRGIARATRESEKFKEKEIETRSKIAELEAASRERQLQLSQVLGIAVPLLSAIRDSQGPLSDDLRQSAKLVEATLRDNLRGRDLLNRAMSNEIQRLRNLGVDVLILDEGGTQSLSAKEKDELLNRAVDSLQVVTQGRVTIRSPKGEDFRLTVVATIPGQAQPVLSLRL